MPTLRTREIAVIARLQRTRLARALVVPARVYSVFGENSVGWALLGLVGAVLDPSRWAVWLLSSLAVVVAQLTSTGVKRLVNRPRPGAVAAADGSFDVRSRGYARSIEGPVVVYASAASRLSFPSSHSTSTMAAVIVFTAMLPALWPVGVLAVLAMGASRVLLGMHFPTDVLAGYLLGAIVGSLAVLLLH